jgi:hypothetical protein
VIGLVAAAVAILLTLPGLFRGGGDPRWLFVIGEVFVIPEHLGAEDVPIHTTGDPERPNYGFDGQFYLFHAYDPLLLEPLHPGSIDLPNLRCQRAGLPLLAWLLALGQPPVIPYTYLLLVVCLTGGMGWALACLAQGWDFSPCWGLVAPILLGVMMSWMRMLTDGPAVACLMIALVLLYRRNLAAHLAWCTLAVLVRETSLICVAAFGVVALAQQHAVAKQDRAGAWPAYREWNGSWYLIPVAVFVAWKLYVDWRLLGMALPLTMPYQVNFGLPGFGFLAKLWSIAHQDRMLVKKVAEACLVLSLGWGAVAGVVHGVRQWRDPVAMALLLYAAMTVCLDFQIFHEDWTFGRVTLPLVAFSLVASLKSRRPALGVVVLVNLIYAVFFYLAKTL